MSLLDDIRKALQGEKKSEFIDQILKEQEFWDALHKAGLTVTAADTTERGRLQPFGVLSKVLKVDLVDLITEISNITNIGTIGQINKIGFINIGNMQIFLDSTSNYAFSSNISLLIRPSVGKRWLIQGGYFYLHTNSIVGTRSAQVSIMNSALQRVGLHNVISIAENQTLGIWTRPVTYLNVTFGASMLSVHLSIDNLIVNNDLYLEFRLSGLNNSSPPTEIFPDLGSIVIAYIELSE